MAGLVIKTEIIAPNTLWEAGVTGRQIRRNRRAENQAGFMNINVIWSKTKREYTWGTVPHTIAVWQALEALFEVTDAGAYGFLLQDPKDPRADHTTGLATLISSAPSYQLIKRYTSTGNLSMDRTIKYVSATGFELRVNGIVQTAGVDYTLSPMTGVVTIPAGPAEADITWAAPFYVPVHFRDDEIEWELVIAGPEAGRRVRGPKIVLQEIKQ